MTERRAGRGGLGRGLGALIPTGPRSPDEALATSEALEAAEAAEVSAAPELSVTAADGPRIVPRVVGDAAAAPRGADAGPADATVGLAHFAEIPVDAVAPNPRQPRTVFDEESLDELVASIHEVGLLQPIVVRRLGTSDGGDGEAHGPGSAVERYELVMGERRLRAARQAGLAVIPAIVRDTPDTEMLRDALLENLHRAQLNPLEEAAAYGQLLEDFESTHEELARRVGKSRSHVSNTMRLLALPPAVQRRVAAGVLSAGHARALLALDDAEAQETLAQRIVAEGLSVRAVEEIVAVGEVPGRTSPRRRAPRATAPGLVDLADRLSDRLETRVRVDLGRTKGKIVVDFATLDDLERIVMTMAPDVWAGSAAEDRNAILGNPTD